MIQRTIRELARLSGGKLHREADGDRVVAGVSIDSRALRPGSLFIPIIGSRLDGHEFAADSLQAGAAAVMWQADHGEPPVSAAIIVDDTTRALQRLAAGYRRELPVRIVAVTGSNGKTTTKDMTAAVLSSRYRVHKTEGNLNNHWGLPLSLLQMPEDAEVAVLEMGMSGFGEIEALSRIAAPDIAVITNIGEAHLQQLGSREGIARAKLEIMAGMTEDGLVVYNGDEPLIARELRRLREEGAALPRNRLAYGFSQHNNLFASDIRTENDTLFFRLNLAGGIEFSLPIPGRHNVLNAIAALAVGRQLGCDPQAMRRRLSEFAPSSMRTEKHAAPGGWTVWNDAYNANPTSMKAALSMLADASGRRKIAVLGDMLELGPQEVEMHREIGRYLDPDKIDFVFGYGPLSSHLVEQAAKRFGAGRARAFTDPDQLVRHLHSLLSPGDAVLVKGSRGMKMERIVEGIVKQEGGGSHGL